MSKWLNRLEIIDGVSNQEICLLFWVTTYLYKTALKLESKVLPANQKWNAAKSD